VPVFSSILAPNCQPIEHAPACRYGTFWPEAPLGLAGRDLAKDKSNARAQRDLSISLEKIGDIKLRAGDAAGALAAYEESL
jgi:hypothetical protein